MKFKLGFTSGEDEKTNDMAVVAAEGEEKRCVPSVVKVGFDDGRVFPYYNDTFELKKGDEVYVEGKLKGKRGIVLDVTTKFKVDLEVYKRVVAKLDFDFYGDFVKINSLMVSFNENALPFEQVKGWYFPPKEKEQEFFVGEGYTFDLLIDDAFVDAKLYNKAVDLLNNGALKYLSISDGVGRAIIGRSNMHIIEFNYNAETCEMTDIYCDCFEIEFCHHCVAVCIALHKLIKDEQYDEEKSFYALDDDVFMNVAIKNVKKITL